MNLNGPYHITTISILVIGIYFGKMDLLSLRSSTEWRLIKRLIIFPLCFLLPERRFWRRIWRKWAGYFLRSMISSREPGLFQMNSMTCNSSSSTKYLRVFKKTHLNSISQQHRIVNCLQRKWSSLLKVSQWSSNLTNYHKVKEYI